MPGFFINHMLKFSFIIPAKPNSNILALNYLGNLNTVFDYEVIVSEGTSPSRQRNCAALKASGDILYFIDDDSRICESCIDILAAHFISTSATVVGGPSLTPTENSPLQHLFATALSSFLGSGAVRNRYKSSGKARQTTERELILCNMAIRRNIFLNNGGFDERLYPNEENEFLDRIHLQGLQLLHDPSLVVYRSQRSTITAFVKQIFNYGRGRGQQTQITYKISVTSFVPMLFVIYLILLLFLIPANIITIIPIILYALLCLLFSLIETINTKSRLTTLLFFLYPVMHISNGLGLFYGLLIGTKYRKETSPISIRIYKSFIKSP